MKAKKLLTIAVLFYTCSAAAQITDASVGNTSVSLSAVSFVNPDTGYACGSSLSGGVYKTTDGSKTWQTILPATAFYNAIAFTGNVGYICRSGSVQKTANGGATWKQVLSDSSYTYKQIGLLDSNAIILSGYYGPSQTPVVKRTSDGGKTWIAYTNSIDAKGTSIACFGNTVIIGGIGCLSVSIDSGKSWTNLNNSSWATMTSIYISGSQTGYLGDDQGNIYQAASGWKNLAVVNDTLGAPYTGVEKITGIYFPFPDTGYAVGEGAIIKTTNGGATWKALTLFQHSYEAMSWATSQVGYAVGQKGAIVKFDYRVKKDTSSGIPVGLPATNHCAAYPNPAGAFILLQHNTIDRQGSLEIIDMKGQVVKQLSINPLQETTPVDISGLQNGCYSFTVTGGNRKESGKFIVSH